MIRRYLFLLCLAAAAALSACNRSPVAFNPSSSKVKRYALKGKIVSIDKPAGAANIENQPIAGFMDQMVMSYTIKPGTTIEQLQPGDSITGDVVVESESNKYWLENVKVAEHSPAPADKPAASLHVPSAGEDVPDFGLLNQSGKRISLRQFHGQTVVLTLIYTRCPFADFCPRVSHEFAAIDRQLRLDPERFGKTHLLSVSFDPAHDTPKVLRAYGLSSSGTADAKVFAHWEFAAIPQAELPQFANFFALTYKEEGGLITHSLSTAVIAPDGKIFKWYAGSDWQASQVLDDVAAASHAAS